MYLTNIYSTANIVTSIGAKYILVNKIDMVSGLMHISFSLVLKTKNQHVCKEIHTQLQCVISLTMEKKNNNRKTGWRTYFSKVVYIAFLNQPYTKYSLPIKKSILS